MALGWTLFQAGLLERCAEQARHALAVDAGLFEAHALLTEALEQLGAFEQAVRHLPGALQVFSVPLDEANAALGGVDPSSPERYWRSKMEWLSDIGRKYRLLPNLYANAHAALGELDAAVDVLEPLVSARAGYVIFMRHDPALRPLHGFRRFEALLKLADVK
jgi:hypothetical protein